MRNLLSRWFSNVVLSRWFESVIFIFMILVFLFGVVGFGFAINVFDKPIRHEKNIACCSAEICAKEGHHGR